VTLTDETNTFSSYFLPIVAANNVNLRMKLAKAIFEKQGKFTSCSFYNYKSVISFDYTLSLFELGVIQIIQDTFLAFFRPFAPPPV
jgi:hypothetical protein